MSTQVMEAKMQEASEATEAAIEQNGFEDGGSISSSSSNASEMPLDTVTKGDEERDIDEAKEALLKVHLTSFVVWGRVVRQLF